jgi:hypothetical protein
MIEFEAPTGLTTAAMPPHPATFFTAALGKVSAPH